MGTTKENFSKEADELILKYKDKGLLAGRLKHLFDVRVNHAFSD